MADAIIIPIRGLTKSMSRLRSDLTDSQVDQIVKYLFENTMHAINHLPYAKIVVTTDRSLESLYPEYEYIYDDGRDLNDALEMVITTHSYTRYLMIMPDLPGLSAKELDKIVHLSQEIDYLIVNTADHGTAACLLPAPFFMHKLFGQSSMDHILEFAKSNRIQVGKFEIKTLLNDLDTFDDLKYWQDQGNAIPDKIYSFES